MSATDAPAMPPTERLLALLDPDPTLLARVLLAMKVWGATWSEAWAAGNPIWSLKPGGGNLWHGRFFPDDLPDPFTDSASAWELETRERLHVEPVGEKWALRWHINVPGRWSEDRRWAACLTALDKYDDGGPLSDLIRPTLERLENVRCPKL